MWSKLLDLIFPNPCMCVLCEKRLQSLGLCASCRQRWQEFAQREGQCQRCGQFGSRAAQCDTCRAWPAYFRGNRALLPYTGNVREAILRFKYHNEPWRAAGFAALLAELPRPEVDLIVPVPLHQRRLAERGYNQSWLLARAAAQQWQLPASDKLLVRSVPTHQQAGLSKNERRQNVQGAFSMPERARTELYGKRVLLVDDILTTGSTLLECARTLHGAGAREIESLTLAAALR